MSFRKDVLDNYFTEGLTRCPHCSESEPDFIDQIGDYLGFGLVAMPSDPKRSVQAGGFVFHCQRCDTAWREAWSVEQRGRGRVHFNCLIYLEEVTLESGAVRPA